MNELMRLGLKEAGLFCPIAEQMMGAISTMDDDLYDGWKYG
jgi:hypothetical protein